jgi:hypothetical protein
MMKLKTKKIKKERNLKKKKKQRGNLYQCNSRKGKKISRMKLKRNPIADTMFRSRSSVSKSKFGHGLADLHTKSQPCFPCGQLAGCRFQARSVLQLGSLPLGKCGCRRVFYSFFLIWVLIFTKNKLILCY